MFEQDMLLCDHCGHAGICVHEVTIRHYCKELELPKGPFKVDIFCSKRIAPVIQLNTPLIKGSSDEFIISKVWPEK